MNENKYTSNAEWPVSAGVTGNRSVDSHISREAAEGVCDLLRSEGLGGDRKIFPLRVWVEPPERAYDILNDGRPISIVWADSSEQAIATYKEIAVNFGLPTNNLMAVLRIQDE